jgi:hypothetical protein
LQDIRESYQRVTESQTHFKGRKVPLVNQEIWYDGSDPETGQWKLAKPEKYATTTGEAIRYLASTKLAGFVLYNQLGFTPFGEWARGGIAWPSRSGEGQHARTTRTGGHGDWPTEFVNVHDPSKPAFKPGPTARAMREAAPEFTGHPVYVASKRRPEVLVTVTADEEPVADAYVYAVPVSVVIGMLQGMRTDAEGIAWFSLRDQRRYRFACCGDDGWKSVKADALLQPINIAQGGPGKFLRVQLPMTYD